MFKSIAAAALALAALSSTAGAATYADRAGFEAATTGTANHVTPAVGVTSSASFGGMTFVQSGAGEPSPPGAAIRA